MTNISKQNIIFLKLSVLLQTAWAAETHLAEGLTLKLRCTVKQYLTHVVSMRRLTVSKTNEHLILPLKM
jgi:hypothetical protein